MISPENSSSEDKSYPRLPNLQPFLERLQAPRRYLLLGISGLLLLVSGALVWRITERGFVVEANSSLRIDVCATDGSDDNIRALKGNTLGDKATCTSGKFTRQRAYLESLHRRSKQI